GPRRTRARPRADALTCARPSAVNLAPTRRRRTLIGAVRKPQLVVAEGEDVAFIDALVVNAHALVVDAVRRAEILDVERAVAANHGGVLARDVAILDRQV